MCLIWYFNIIFLEISAAVHRIFLSMLGLEFGVFMPLIPVRGILKYSRNISLRILKLLACTRQAEAKNNKGKAIIL